MMQLSKRLQAVADLVDHTGCVADVGTDHGYIPIYLIEHEICRKAIAMDIRKGPLQRAQEHIEEHQLGAYIQTRLSDGLTGLGYEEADAIVIAGMGGALMGRILTEGAAVMGDQTVLVLQPQSELSEFRRFLQEQGYQLLAEDMVKEDGKFYPMMKVCRSNAVNGQSLMGAGMPPCPREELEYGPLLIRQHHPVLKEYLQWQLGQKEKILENLSQNARTEGKAERIKQLEAEIAVILRLLHQWEKAEKEAL